MKLSILVIATLLITNNVFSQQATPGKETYDYHLQKRKQNISGGSILLGSGLTLATAGVIVGLSSMSDESKSKSTIGNVLLYSGIAAMVGSIPCFVAAGNHKQKALVLKNQPTATLRPLQFRATPAVAFVIRL